MKSQYDFVILCLFLLLCNKKSKNEKLCKKKLVKVQRACYIETNFRTSTHGGRLGRA